MKGRLRQILSLLLAVTMLGVFFACSPERQTGAEQPVITL